MKRSIIILFALLMVLGIANLAFAQRDAITVKFGINNIGSEWERISDKGTGFFISEYDTYYYYSTLIGVRKHSSVTGNNKYFGFGIGIDGWHPTVDAHVGAEFRVSALPSFMFVRAEGGLGLALASHPYLIPHLGAGIGIDFDWNWFKF